MKLRQMFSMGLVLLIGLVVGWTLYRSLVKDAASPSTLAPQLLSTSNLKNSMNPKESTFADKPFGELTIPVLRQRSYQSQLRELVPVSQKATYTSYLTSYDSDGFRINALVTRPRGDQPVAGWPAVVFIHGYIPPSQYQTQERYLDHIDRLAASGLVVMKIDLRGHGQSEGEATGAYYSSDYVVDTLNAVSALQQSGFVNQSAIGLWGHSMAGNVALRSLAVQPDLDAAVIWAGAVYSYADFQKYGISDASYNPPDPNSPSRRRRQALLDTYGEFNAESDFWSQVAATNYLSDLKGAVQLHHAVDDSVVNIGFGRDLQVVLDSEGVRHQFFEYQTGGHNLTGSSFNSAMERSITFFRQELK